MDYLAMITRRNLLLSVTCMLVACSSRDVEPTARTTIIMVRHADRAGDDLNPTGIARAEALPAALKDFALDGIYSPDIKRNLDTARPLSQATGLPVTITPKEYVAADMTANHPDGTAIWIGNKGNLRSIWAELGGSGPAPQEYGEIGVIQLQGGAPPVVSRLTVTP